MEDHKVFTGVYGRSGAGKTWFMHSLPGPRLILDTEGGSSYVHQRTDRPIEVVRWDPTTQASPPDGLTEHTSVVVDIQEGGQIPGILGYLRKGDHPFESLGLDSLTEEQKQLKTTVSGSEIYDPNAVFDQQAWGRLLNNGEVTIRTLRDLTRPEANKPINVMAVMGADTENVPFRPLLQGGIRKTLIFYFDIFGYYMTGTNDDGEETWALQIKPSPDVEAKCRPHLVKATYGSHILNPDMTEIQAVINGQNPTEKANQ